MVGLGFVSYCGCVYIVGLDEEFHIFSHHLDVLIPLVYIDRTCSQKHAQLNPFSKSCVTSESAVSTAAFVFCLEVLDF